MAVSFSCPRCGASSASPDDFREGYCAACRDWTGGPLSRAWSWDELRRIAGVISRAAEDTGSGQIAAGVIPAEQAAFGPLTWDRPDSGPLGDLQQARRAGALAALAAMEQRNRARELAAARAARRAPRSSRERRLRTRQVLDDAEALIARLDGEGYKVADKARREEAAAGTLPPDWLDQSHAMSWRRGDPAL